MVLYIYLTLITWPCRGNVVPLHPETFKGIRAMEEKFTPRELLDMAARRKEEEWQCKAVRAASMPHWVAVSKRLPRPGVKVPVACLEEGTPANGNLTLVTGLVNDAGEWFFDGDAKVAPVYWQEVELPTLNGEDL